MRYFLIFIFQFVIILKVFTQQPAFSTRDSADQFYDKTVLEFYRNLNRYSPSSRKDTLKCFNGNKVIRVTKDSLGGGAIFISEDTLLKKMDATPFKFGRYSELVSCKCNDTLAVFHSFTKSEVHSFFNIFKFENGYWSEYMMIPSLPRHKIIYGFRRGNVPGEEFEIGFSEEIVSADTLKFIIRKGIYRSPIKQTSRGFEVHCGRCDIQDKEIIIPITAETRKKVLRPITEVNKY